MIRADGVPAESGRHRRDVAAPLADESGRPSTRSSTPPSPGLVGGSLLECGPPGGRAPGALFGVPGGQLTQSRRLEERMCNVARRYRGVLVAVLLLFGISPLLPRSEEPGLALAQDATREREQAQDPAEKEQ